MLYRALIAITALLLISSPVFAADMTPVPNQAKFSACDVGCEKNLDACFKKWGGGDSMCLTAANWCMIGCCLSNTNVCHPLANLLGK
jgi:hypothetical protein